MILRMDRSTRLSDLQVAFTGMFAYLRLEFFKTPHAAQEIFLKKDLRNPAEPALAANKGQVVTAIEFDGSWKVSEVEDLFAKETGLFIQVSRKSGNVWIETSLTDDWTLEQQNREGELLSAALPPQFITPNS